MIRRMSGAEIVGGLMGEWPLRNELAMVDVARVGSMDQVGSYQRLLRLCFARKFRIHHRHVSGMHIGSIRHFGLAKVQLTGIPQQ